MRTSTPTRRGCNSRPTIILGKIVSPNNPHPYPSKHGRHSRPFISSSSNKCRNPISKVPSYNRRRTNSSNSSLSSKSYASASHGHRNRERLVQPDLKSSVALQPGSISRPYKAAQQAAVHLNKVPSGSSSIWTLKRTLTCKRWTRTAGPNTCKSYPSSNATIGS